MLLITIIITLIYLILIGAFVFGFDRIKDFKFTNLVSETTFSIVVPFRNEAENLPFLLQSIGDLQYPKELYEIIFVDDDSDDNSVDLIKSFIRSVDVQNIKIIKNERFTNSPKKDAITKAIALSKYDWIVTTDADCILPKYWLKSLDEYIQIKKPKCIVAPVTYKIENNILQQFQLTNVLSLQGATIGGFGIGNPILCNGANLAYKREMFDELNGFKGNSNIASGDDIFLLEKALKTYKNDVHYLKCQQAIVSTKSQSSWSCLTSQHIRWAAKIRAYSNRFGKLVGFIILLMNTLIITSLLLSIFGVNNFKTLVYIALIKFSIDFLLIFKTATFFDQKDYLKSYAISFLIYPFFSVYVAVMSIFKDYKWKGRTYKL